MGNSASSSGGALSADENSDLSVVNSVLWGNSAPAGPEVYIGNWSSSTSSVTISCCDVDGGQPSVHISSGCTLNWGAGNIDDDPLFADAANDDFHLTWFSPCRDVGDNSAVTTANDFEGNPRIALGNSVLDFSVTVPLGWIAGEIKYLQALVGPWGGSLTRLTDPAALKVE